MDYLIIYLFSGVPDTAIFSNRSPADYASLRTNENCPPLLYADSRLFIYDVLGWEEDIGLEDM